MATLTKAQLVETIEALRAQLETSTLLYQGALNTIKRLEAQHVAVTSVASAVNTMSRVRSVPARPHIVMPQWQVDRAEAMAAARALAMSSQRSVAV